MDIALTPLLSLGLGLLSAAVGGVFLAFSDFVMRGLIGATPSAGAEAMQQINRTVLRSIFVTSLLLLVPLSVLAALYALFMLEGAVLWLWLFAAVVYCTSVFAMTLFGNVPMNQQLDKLDVTSQAGTEYWLHYGVRWTRLNHVRTAGSFISSASFLLAAMV